MGPVKPHIKKNQLYPHLWGISLKLGTLVIRSWGTSPKDAYNRLHTEPYAVNRAGFTIR